MKLSAHSNSFSPVSNESPLTLPWHTAPAESAGQC